MPVVRSILSQEPMHARLFNSIHVEISLQVARALWSASAIHSTLDGSFPSNFTWMCFFTDLTWKHLFIWTKPFGSSATHFHYLTTEYLRFVAAMSPHLDRALTTIKHATPPSVMKESHLVHTPILITPSPLSAVSFAALLGRLTRQAWSEDRQHWKVQTGPCRE